MQTEALRRANIILKKGLFKIRFLCYNIEGELMFAFERREMLWYMSTYPETRENASKIC